MYSDLEISVFSSRTAESAPGFLMAVSLAVCYIDGDRTSDDKNASDDKNKYIFVAIRH